MKQQFLHMKGISFLFLCMLYSNASAQEGITVFGNTSIDRGQELYVKDIPLNLKSKVLTSRTTKSKVSLSENATINLENQSYVNGYLRTYKKGKFLFTVGSSGLYSPLEIELGQATAMDVAYNTGVYNKNEINSTELELISPTEYWDVLGQNDGVLKLSWSDQNKISDYVNDLKKLVLVGWNGSRWEIIKSTKVLGSSLTKGLLVSSGAIDFKKYSAVTFGVEKAKLATVEQSDSFTYIFIQDSQLQIKVSENIQTVFVYDISGQQIIDNKMNHQKQASFNFNHPKGVYIVKLLTSEGKSITKKVINR